jgi:hypothetical protein
VGGSFCVKTRTARATVAQPRMKRSSASGKFSRGIVFLSAVGPPVLSPRTTIAHVGVVAIVLAACALLLVIAAEWPHIAGKTGLNLEPRPRRARRRRRKSGLTVIEGGDSDDFAASVERDLDSLPVIEDRDDSTRR